MTPGTGASGGEGEASPHVSPARGIHTPEVAVILLPPMDSGPFSSDAYAELRRTMEGYLGSLVEESRRIARGHQADVVSPAYVRLATDALRARPRLGWHTLAVGFAATFFGAGGSGSWP